MRKWLINGGRCLLFFRKFFNSPELIKTFPFIKFVLFCTLNDFSQLAFVKTSLRKTANNY